MQTCVNNKAMLLVPHNQRVNSVYLDTLGEKLLGRLEEKLQPNY